MHLQVVDSRIESFARETLLKVGPLGQRPIVHDQRSEKGHALLISRPRHVDLAMPFEILQLSRYGLEGPTEPVVGEVPCSNLTSESRVVQDDPQQLGLSTIGGA